MTSARALAVVLAITATAAAGTLQVGPGKPYAAPCAAIAAAQPGDTIEVDTAGTYDGDTCAWSTDNLTVRGVGAGRAKIDLTGVTPAQQKGIFTIAAPTATIENFELSGAAISSAAGNNGAGIRHQGGDLTITNCYFHDNQDGILAAPATDGVGSIAITGSEFANNGAGDGFSHNMYINHYASFSLVGSYTHGAKVGHLVKSRAERNFVAYNRITDEAGTTASYEIDFPQGGISYVIGNLIEQSATSQNPTIITTGEEGLKNTGEHLYVINNTIVNDLGSGTFVAVAAGTTTLVENNIFTGGGTIPQASADITAMTNFDDSMGDPKLVDRAGYDYHLAAGSPCIDRGTPPATGVDQQALAPDHEWVAVGSAPETRTTTGAAIDIGAYEVGGGGIAPAIDGPGGIPDGDVTAPAGKSGCCSIEGSGGAGSAVLALGVALAIRRRRKPAR